MINENLTAKKATTLSTSRYNATKNSFTIKHFYDFLEKSVSDLGLHEGPDLIWKCGESGLPHEPSKLTIISRKGQKTLLVRKFFLHLLLSYSTSKSKKNIIKTSSCFSG